MEPNTPPFTRWTILCQVVDNFGDAGVLWRLARRLAAGDRRTVALRIDAIEALAALVPDASIGATVDGVRIEAWPWGDDEPLPDVLITGFDARPPESLRRRMRPGSPLWITVDHLSAEAWVESVHRSPSPKADGCIEHYFSPGFTAATGGLLLEPGVLEARDLALAERAQPAERTQRTQRAQRAESPDPAARPGSATRDDPADTCLVFCYRPSPLRTLARALATSVARDGAGPSRGWTIVVPRPGTAGAAPTRRRRAGVPSTASSAVRIERRPFVPQSRFDDLLRTNRLNLVRGEDSLVRAIWAARPFVWQAWRQSLDTRRDKVEALLAHQAAWLAPEDQAALAWLTRWWNGLISAPGQAEPARRDCPAGALEATGAAALPAVAAALATVLTHQARIEAGLAAWGDALSRRELADELARFAIALTGRPL